MRYKLTFTVNDRSEKGNLVDKQCEVMKEYGHNTYNIKMDYLVKQGCDLAKKLNKNPDCSIYNFFNAEILED